jgi:hypothetical protein
MADNNEVNRYSKLIESIFFGKYKKGDQEVYFERPDLIKTSEELGIKLPLNLGDIIYSFKYRASLPSAIISLAPDSMEWEIKNVGRAKYAFKLVSYSRIIPDAMLVEIKIPNATPSIVGRYALNDEQALLTKMRYNRLLDIFTGVTCYSLQNHLRTTVPEIGQVETDELYVGIDKNGKQYVFPVQAKGGSDELGIVQIEQDIKLCEHKFPELIVRAIASQFMSDNVIAIFEFKLLDDEIKKIAEKHYKLVEYSDLSSDEIKMYNSLENIN